MRVEDVAAAQGLDVADQAVLVLDALPAHQDDAEGAELAAGAREILVLQHVVAKALQVALHHGGVEGLVVGHLQIGPAAIHLERLQRGVVEGTFVGRRQAGGQQLGLGAAHRDLAAHAPRQRAHGLDRIGAHHGEHGVAIRRKPVAHAGVVRGEARLDGGEQEQIQLGRAGGAGKVQRAAVAGKQHGGVQPLHMGVQRHLHVQDHAVGAEGVLHLLNLVAGQLDDARLALHRHHARAQQVAGVAQDAVADGADAAEAAGNEAADGGHVPGGGPHAQALAGFARGHLDVEHARAGLGAHAAGLHVEHARQGAHVHHDAAVERHALAVVAGAAGAHGEGQLVARHHLNDLAHVVLGAHAHHQIGHAVGEQLGQHRAVPEEILGQLAALRQPRDHVQAPQIGLHLGPVDARQIVGKAGVAGGRRGRNANKACHVLLSESVIHGAAPHPSGMKPKEPSGRGAGQASDRRGRGFPGHGDASLGVGETSRSE